MKASADFNGTFEYAETSGTKIDYEIVVEDSRIRRVFWSVEVKTINERTGELDLLFTHVRSTPPKEFKREGHLIDFPNEYEAVIYFEEPMFFSEEVPCNWINVNKNLRMLYYDDKEPPKEVREARKKKAEKMAKVIR